jgi:hypothetical protein
MLHPKNYHVNETWIVFKLNDSPISTEEDGDFNCLVLMDAASCFIVSSAMIPTSETGPSQLESKRMLKQGKAHKNGLPKELIIPNEQHADFLASEAERLSITIVRLPESQLQVYTKEAREAFRDNFGGDRTQ